MQRSSSVTSSMVERAKALPVMVQSLHPIVGKPDCRTSMLGIARHCHSAFRKCIGGRTALSAWVLHASHIQGIIRHQFLELILRIAQHRFSRRDEATWADAVWTFEHTECHS
eukprot:5687960-Amphidinium_carterae.1